jgi:hypothetical protein
VAQSAGGRRAGSLVFQSTFRFARLAAAALASGAAISGAGGCGGHRPRPAVLRLERADTVLLAHTLQRLRVPIGSEVAAARAAWPALAVGLPRDLPQALRLQVSAAEARARALVLPGYVTSEAGGLTGPAAEVGGMLESYAALTRRGWRLLAAALAAQRGGAGAAAAARFLRANAALYIYCVYDGHYDLSLIGKALQESYRRLGGPRAFGGALAPRQVEALARAYSIPAARLIPHPSASLSV